MFIRKKKNRSGTTGVIVIDKSGGQFRELKTIGVSSDEQEIALFYQQGKKWIATQIGGQDMFTLVEQQREEKQVADYLLSNIKNILLNGPQLILDRVFKLVGFDVKRHQSKRRQGLEHSQNHNNIENQVARQWRNSNKDHAHYR